MSASPWRARLAQRIADTAARLLLGPQVQVPEPASPPQRQRELLAQTDQLNAAAERYFAEFPSPEYLLGKPYSDFAHFPRYLFNLGVLCHSLRLAPGDVVLDLGAGSCWVSHFLNRLGCSTVSVDVSPTVLDLGRKLFERDPNTHWDLEPRFLPYDGRRLPVDDRSCDRIVLHDAFHHLPNSDEILAEMARVLQPGGIVAMSEPGRVHSASAEARQEAEETGVLENDVVAERLAEAALGHGFTRVEIAPVALDVAPVPAAELPEFLRGKGLSRFWRSFAAETLQHHFLVLYKGEEIPTTRRPGHLAAHIELAGAAASTTLRAQPAETVRLRFVVANTGDSLWLSDPGARPGRALLGGRMLLDGPEESTAGSRERIDWCRGHLPRDLAPGESVEVEMELTAPEQPGRHRLLVDMVAEQVAWFADRGSPTLDLTLDVRPPTGHSPPSMEEV